MRALSIRQKLLLITMTSTAVALSLVAAAFLALQYFSFRQQMQDDISTLAEVIGDQSTASLTYDDAMTAGENLETLASQKAGIMAACLYTNDSLFVSYHAANFDKSKLPQHANSEGWRFSEGHLAGFQDIFLNGEKIGSIYICSDLKELHALTWRYVSLILLFVSSSLLVAYILALRLQLIIARPILHLAQTARIVTHEKNYSLRAQKTSDDELGMLIDGFNGMLTQIQQRDVALNQANTQLENRVAERTEDLQQQFGRISLLNQITYAIAARQDFESILLVVLQQLEEHLPADYAVCNLFDEAAGMLQNIVRGPKAQSLASRMEMPQQILIKDTVFADCVRGEMVYVPDISQMEMPLVKKLTRAEIFSGVGLPLMIDGKMFGLLILMRRAVDGFSQPEREFLRGLSAHITVAIQQVQLYQHLSKAYDELRITQQAIMQQERLKALGQMASGIAHDINNALSPIVGFAELIAQTEPNLSADGRKYLRYIKTSGDDITHIVAGLREFYRLREQNEALHPLQLNQLVEQAIDLTRPRWRDQAQHHSVMIKVQPKLMTGLPKCVGIESELRSVLTNLIINAVDAMPKGGTVTISTHATGQKVVLEVSDTGIGMDEQTRKRCLEPFFSTKGKRGTGLGLAMVYGIVERHEGKIEIDSKLGKGTTMRLIFPAFEEKQALPVETETETAPGPFRILFIDDEPAIRDLVSEMLQQDGHQVEVADGGKAGVAAFRAAHAQGRPFDVIMTDLGMPHMDGREVARVIKSESPGLPVIMLTGWGAFMQGKRSSQMSQIDGIVSKPPRINEIRILLRKVVPAIRQNRKPELFSPTASHISLQTQDAADEPDNRPAPAY